MTTVSLSSIGVNSFARRERALMSLDINAHFFLIQTIIGLPSFVATRVLGFSLSITAIA
jgi:hypothetical protein